MRRGTEVFFEKLNEYWSDNTSKDYRNYVRMHLTDDERFIDMMATVGEKGIIEILEAIFEESD